MPNRKKSADPAQEALRAHKDEFNTATSDLISKLIAFKRGLNGRGDKNFGLPVSNIKDPLPSQVNSLLSQLSSDFRDVVARAGQIINEQNQYSQKRKKTIRRQASNPLTRFWSWMNLDLKGKNLDEQYRLSLLKTSAKLSRELKELRTKALTESVENIPNIIDAKKQLTYLLNVFAYTLISLSKNYQSNKEEELVEEKPVFVVSKDEEEKLINKIQKEINDRKYLPADIKHHLDWLGARVNKWITANITSQESEKENLFQEIMNKYQEILEILSDKISNEKNQKIELESISQFVALKTEHEFVSKAGILDLLHEKKHQLSFHSLAVNRLKISNTAKQAIVILDKIMDSLEKRLDFEFIDHQFKHLGKFLNEELKAPIMALTKYYEHYSFEQDMKEQQLEKSKEHQTRQKTRRYLYSDI